MHDDAVDRAAVVQQQMSDVISRINNICSIFDAGQMLHELNDRHEGRLQDDDVAKRKYQDGVLVSMSHYSDLCTDRLAILTQLHEFFAVTSSGDGSAMTACTDDDVTGDDVIGPQSMTSYVQKTERLISQLTELCRQYAHQDRPQRRLPRQRLHYSKSPLRRHNGRERDKGRQSTTATDADVSIIVTKSQEEQTKVTVMTSLSGSDADTDGACGIDTSHSMLTEISCLVQSSDANEWIQVDTSSVIGPLAGVREAPPGERHHKSLAVNDDDVDVDENEVKKSAEVVGSKQRQDASRRPSRATPAAVAALQPATKRRSLAVNKSRDQPLRQKPRQQTNKEKRGSGAGMAGKEQRTSVVSVDCASSVVAVRLSTDAHGCSTSLAGVLGEGDTGAGEQTSDGLLESPPDLADDDAWTSVSSDQLATRFTQYRAMTRARLTELEQQVADIDNKAVDRVDMVKTQFADQRAKWITERQLLIGCVDQAQKLQAETDGALVQMEMMIRDYETLVISQTQEQQLESAVTDESMTDTVAAVDDDVTTPAANQNSADAAFAGDNTDIQTEAADPELVAMTTTTNLRNMVVSVGALCAKHRDVLAEMKSRADQTRAVSVGLLIAASRDLTFADNLDDSQSASAPDVKASNDINTDIDRKLSAAESDKVAQSIQGMMEDHSRKLVFVNCLSPT